MSCSVSRLVSYYSDKVNIYDNKSFIKLPNYRTCPAPSCIILAPQIVIPGPGPYAPPITSFIPQPLNYPGAFCGGGVSYGTSIPFGGTPSQPTGCIPCGSR